jgi:hypothetical protein
MDIAMMQPTFMPWLGYFELIEKANKFIFLDDFQFSIQSFHQRNRLFINKGQIGWYSVPVKKDVSFRAPLNITRINDDFPWRIKMQKSIQQNYCKARYFSDLFPRISEWLLAPSESLAAYNISFIKLVCEYLGWQKDFVFSSQFPSTEKRSTKVLHLLRLSRADRYLCANGAFEYMQAEGVFPVENIEVVFQDHRPQLYHQVGSPGVFFPYLSILDALFNVGPVQTSELVKTGTTKWLTWQEMVNLPKINIKVHDEK